MAKKKSYVPKGKIINNLRSIHRHCKHKRDAKNAAKVAPSTYGCDFCGKWVYEGTSDKNFAKLQEENSEKTVVRGKIEMDHQEAVIDPKKGWQGWDEYINRMWCSPDGYNRLCRECHQEKTNRETKKRSEK
jgi:hypothetical protein